MAGFVAASLGFWLSLGGGRRSLLQWSKVGRLALPVGAGLRGANFNCSRRILNRSALLTALSHLPAWSGAGSCWFRRTGRGRSNSVGIGGRLVRHRGQALGQNIGCAHATLVLCRRLPVLLLDQHQHFFQLAQIGAGLILIFRNRSLPLPTLVTVPTGKPLGKI